MARYIGGSVVVAVVATIFNSVTVEETAAGASASEALAAGLSRAALLMAIMSGLGIALALLMARHQQARPSAVDLAAAAAGATSHTIPTRPVNSLEHALGRSAGCEWSPSALSAVHAARPGIGAVPERQTAPGNELLLFLADLGAALSAIGETVDAVEERLALIARAYGLEDARFSVFPTSLFLTLGRGEAATIEPTKRLSATPRLDQIAAVHRLAEEAERGAIAPGAGIARLEEIRATGSRYGPLASVLGYTTLTIGIALILRPAPRDVAAAAVLGTVVGVLRLLARGRRSLEVLMPFLAAFAVALLTALAVKYDVTDPGLRAMIAALVVFIPGVALTTAVLELTEGQMISGSSRLVWATTQLGLIAFGIVAGVSAAGVPAERAFSSSDALLGDWAPWLGVLVFAVGVTVAHSTPPGALLSLLVVLYAAWTGQVLGDALFGAYSSGFVGAVVMTFVGIPARAAPVDDARVRHVPAGLLAARPRLARADRADDLPRLPGLRLRRPTSSPWSERSRRSRSASSAASSCTAG